LDQEVVLLLLLLEELPLAEVLEVQPKRHQRRKKRRKVCISPHLRTFLALIFKSEKEESDEDMGFGLFD
jgi:hypothetical protein